MTTYYNEFDPKAAGWLRELINAGEIPAGDVDTRSICDVKADDLKGYIQCHFFAGVGGWPLALRLAGWPDDRPVWSGSAPCQAFSVAGEGKGTGDHRDLWPVFAGLIGERNPPVVIGEQVAAAIGFGWFDRLRADMEAQGYAVGGHVLGAHSAGAFHGRQRLYWIAMGEPFVKWIGGRGVEGLGTARDEMVQPEDGPDVADESGDGCEESCHVDVTDGQRGCGGSAWGQDAGDARQPGEANFWSGAVPILCRDGKTRFFEPGIFPLVDGVPGCVGHCGDHGVPEREEIDAVRLQEMLSSYVNATPEGRVMRIKGYGNAIVPQVAAMFIRAFMDLK